MLRSSPFAGLVLCKNSLFHFPAPEFGKITSLPTWYSRGKALPKAESNRGGSLTVVFISTEGWACSFSASRNSMSPSRILIANPPQIGNDAMTTSLRWGLPWQCWAEPAFAACALPMAGWCGQPCGSSRRESAPAFAQGCPWSWYHFSSSERIGLAGHLLIPGEPAVCKGMAVMAGAGMWCGLCRALPPRHHPPKVQT